MIFNFSFGELTFKGFNISVTKSEFRQRITDLEVTLNISRNHSNLLRKMVENYWSFLIKLDKSNFNDYAFRLKVVSSFEKVKMKLNDSIVSIMNMKLEEMKRSEKDKNNPYLMALIDAYSDLIMNLKMLRAKMSNVDDKNISGNILREIVETFLSIIIFTVRKFYEKILEMKNNTPRPYLVKHVWVVKMKNKLDSILSMLIKVYDNLTSILV
ncbi:hypothetical protein [Stygiolobus azoricus]|uniref:Uncharacterized protein n=1 Tax=Stygiolobus azoricus TaxID=41675 RepID=A0A650CRB6_9CREN|nr:hypothetical protein [Stygiolobus azoricus]QGR20401.1 hypothetical protein D1868_10675 [Stygiolobus azoricus]